MSHTFFRGEGAKFLRDGLRPPPLSYAPDKDARQQPLADACIVSVPIRARQSRKAGLWGDHQLVVRWSQLKKTTISQDCAAKHNFCRSKWKALLDEGEESIFACSVLFFSSGVSRTCRGTKNQWLLLLQNKLNFVSSSGMWTLAWENTGRATGWKRGVNNTNGTKKSAHKVRMASRPSRTSFALAIHRGTDIGVAKGGYDPKNVQHIMAFCASRSGVSQ